jgi:ubiquinol-cytochrome c reductase iron-sulfur subunit
VALNHRRCAIVHGRPAERLVGQGEAAGLNNVNRNVKAGGETQCRPQILRNVGLIESKAHSRGFRWQGGFVRHRATRGVAAVSIIRRPELRLPWEIRVSEHGSSSQTADGAHAGETRRDFIHIAAMAVGAGGVAAVAWPFVQQLGPAADTRALSSAEVDVTKVPEGGEIRVLIGGMPFFVRHRTAAEIQSARAVDVSSLRDPETDDERLAPKADGTLNPAILVTSGSCTHLGCVPVGPAQGTTGEFGGWYCPCHGSHYDTSGRIRKGPAPTNLPVPAYEYDAAGTIIKISL